MNFAHWRDRRRWLLALGVSAVAMALIAAYWRVTVDECARYLEDETRLVVIAVFLWMLLLLLGMVTWRTRLACLGFAAFTYFFLIPNVDRLPLAGIEAKAIKDLRGVADAVEKAKSQSSAGAYPQTLPEFAIGSHLEKYYRLEYGLEHSTPDGPVEGFVVRAVPKRPDCVIRVFAIRSDGHLYYRYGSMPEIRLD